MSSVIDTVFVNGDRNQQNSVLSNCIQICKFTAFWWHHIGGCVLAVFLSSSRVLKWWHEPSLNNPEISTDGNWRVGWGVHLPLYPYCTSCFQAPFYPISFPLQLDCYLPFFTMGAVVLIGSHSNRCKPNNAYCIAFVCFGGNVTAEYFISALPLNIFEIRVQHLCEQS